MKNTSPTRRWRLAGASIAALTCLAAIGIPTAASMAAAPTPQRTAAVSAAKLKAKPTIVLVHGAWADESSFAPVTKRLQADGYKVLAAPNPLRSLSSDAAYLDAFLEQRTHGPVILVGHSYGGEVITDAALADPDVKGLVYIDAFVPAEGESVFSLLAKTGGVDPSKLFDAVAYPGAPAGDVDLYIKTAIFGQVFANGVSATKAAQLAAGQEPITLRALSEPSGKPAWTTLPSWYVLGTADNVIPPTLQRFMAKRAHSHITRVRSGHLAMLTHPATVAQVIETAAKRVG